MQIDVKTLIAIMTMVAALGGFYYTTQHRLDHLEDQIDMIYDELQKTNASLGKIKKNKNTTKKK